MHRQHWHFNDHCAMQWEKERLEIMQIIRRGGFSFEEMAIRLFYLQYTFNVVYKRYIDFVYASSPVIHGLEDIPFLPIQFFKSHTIQTGLFTPQIIFESSGTTVLTKSRHFIRDLNWYKFISTSCFKQAFYPENVRSYSHLAVLPSYTDNKASSLLYMIDYFISLKSGGYYHLNPDALVARLAVNRGEPMILWGVSYSLYQWPYFTPYPAGSLIIETGGMKGREKEITRQELHQKIQEKFGVQVVSSEYGMTELLSQAYALENGVFNGNFTLKALPRKINDPLSLESINQQAVLNFIDLANIDSCAFIATDDLGKVYGDGRFEVLGRIDRSDIRGCNLLIS